MPTITDVQGNMHTVECLGCAIVNHTVQSSVISIKVTKHFDIHQDFEIPIPGFVIVSSIRHVQSIEQLTTEEVSELTTLLVSIRKAQRSLGIELVTLVQEERSSHFHIWLFPWHKEFIDLYGKKVESIAQVMRHARAHNSPIIQDQVKEYAQKLTQLLS